MAFMATLTECIRAPWAKKTGLDPNISSKSYSKSNGFFDYADNSLATRLLPLVGSDAADKVHINGACFHGARNIKTFNLSTSAAEGTQAFWIADATYTITSISLIYQTADGATNTGYIAKATGTQAPTSTAVVPLMVGTFNLNTTTKTVYNATLPSWVVPTPSSNLNPGVQISAGDRLVFVMASAVTSLAGVSITIEMIPGNKTLSATYAMNANASIATTSIFVANGSYTVTGVKAVWSAAGTNGGTVTGDITIDNSTTAPGAGTSVLTAAFSVKTTANTVVTPALSVTAANLRLNAGARLTYKSTGTLTSLAGLVVTVYYVPINDAIDISIPLGAAASLVDQTIFTAMDKYELILAQVSYGTAEGGALTAQLTRESGTTTAGSGTAIQSGSFNLNTTTNTPQVASLLSLVNNYLLPGDRLSVHFSAGATTTANFILTITVRPR